MCCVQMLWTFGRFGFQDETLMDMMHDIALKLQANCNSKALADVLYAMAQMGWADARLHNLVADYAMDNIQVGTHSITYTHGQHPGGHARTHVHIHTPLQTKGPAAVQGQSTALLEVFEQIKVDEICGKNGKLIEQISSTNTQKQKFLFVFIGIVFTNGKRSRFVLQASLGQPLH